MAKYVAALLSNDSYENCLKLKTAMQEADTAASLKGKYQYRIRARGPRATPEVIEFYKRKEYTWACTKKPWNVPYTGTYEQYCAERPWLDRSAKRRAMQDLPTQFGKTFSLYRNYRYDY